MERGELRKAYPYLVCWNNHSCIDWFTKREMISTIRTSDVNWIQDQQSGQLEPFELKVFETYVRLSDPEEGTIPGNKEIAQFLSTEENKVTRNAVARARRNAMNKLHLRPGW